MFSFIDEINKYSVGRHREQYIFRTKLNEAKRTYLKYINFPIKDEDFSSTNFKKPVLDENKFEVAVDSSAFYNISLEEERELIKKRAENLNFLRSINNNFELCRNLCHVSDSRFKKFHFFDNEHQSCVTDCLNVRTEVLNVKKPHNNEKVFVWLG